MSRTLTFSPASGAGFDNTPARRRLIYRQIRQAAAMAAGVEAIATQAIEANDATPDQLDHIADLAGHLTEHLNQLSGLFADMVTAA